MRIKPQIALISMSAVLLSVAAIRSGSAQSSFPNIAIVEADPTVIVPGELFDLDGATVTFTPRNGGISYEVTSGPLNSVTVAGERLNLGVDGSVSRLLQFRFPFYGSSLGTVFINENGSLTFSASSSPAHFNAGGNVDLMGPLGSVFSRFAGMGSRIAVLWQDWDPTASGGVFFDQSADRAVITWDNVTLSGTTMTASFQAVLSRDGVIQMSYSRVPVTPGGGYLVGVSPGTISTLFVLATNLSRGSPPEQQGILEAPAQVFGRSPRPLILMTGMARKFLETQKDQFDQLVMYSNFEQELGGAFAFEQTIRNSTTGVGLSPSSFTEIFGSSGRLQSLLNMNQLSRYSNDPACLRDPRCRLPGNNDSALTVLGQEAGHLWLAFASFNDRGFCSDMLRGRGLSHWSFFMDSDGSVMEGNKWRDNNNGTFTTIDDTIRFGPLDQYFMGLRLASEVPPVLVINDPSGTTRTRSSTPRTGETVFGARKDVTIQDVIACSGSRYPLSGATAVNPTSLKQAFVLVVPAGSTPSNEDLAKLETIRTAWEAFYDTATEGRGSVETTLTEEENSFILSLRISGIRLAPGGRASGIRIAVLPQNSFDQPVNLRAILFPSNDSITATLEPDTVMPGQSTVLTVNTSPTTPQDRFLMVIEGTGGGRTSALSLFVETGSLNFSPIFSPSSLTIARGETLEATLIIARLNSTAGEIQVVPPDTSGLKIKVKPGTLSTTGSMLTFRIRAKGGARTGSYELRFLARDATGLSRPATLNVTVVAQR